MATLKRTMERNIPVLQHRWRLILAGLMALVVVLGVVLPTLAAGTWTSTGNLNEKRAMHRAVRLNDGRVFVIGGQTWSSGTYTSEIYDPASGTWTTTARQNFESVRSIVNVLTDGRVLVAGSEVAYSSNSTQSEIYNPATDSWTVTGNLNVGRADGLSVRLNDGRVLVAGGGSATAEIFDPATNSWTLTGSMSSTHFGGIIALLPDGKVLVAGEGDASGLNNYSASAEVYDPATGNWSATDSMHVARGLARAATLSDGRVLVAAGLGSNGWLSSAEIYNPATGTWSLTGNMNDARYKHTATTLADGRVLVVGIPYLASNPRSVEVYDPATNSWTRTTDLPGDRSDQTATLLNNGQVLIAAGIHNDPSSFEMNTALLYTPDSTPPPATSTPPPATATPQPTATTPPPTVTPPPAGNTMHVGDLDGYSRPRRSWGWRAFVTVTVLNSTGAPVANATVHGQWTGGGTRNGTCTTDGSGKCRFGSPRVRNRRATKTFTVTGIDHASFTYDAAANTDPDGDSDGTTIIVTRP